MGTQYAEIPDKLKLFIEQQKLFSWQRPLQIVGLMFRRRGWTLCG